MSSFRLILRSLTYHWRLSVAVALGVAVATAVLAGALLVGDSMRASLRELVVERLGRIDQILVADHFFRSGLANEIAASDRFAEDFTAARLLYSLSSLDNQRVPFSVSISLVKSSLILLHFLNYF